MNRDVAVVGLFGSRHIDLDERVDAVDRATLQDLLRRQTRELNLHVAQARIRVKIATADGLLQVGFGALGCPLLLLLRRLEVLDVDVVKGAPKAVEGLRRRRRIRRDVVLRARTQQIPVTESVLRQGEAELSRIVHGVVGVLRRGQSGAGVLVGQRVLVDVAARTVDQMGLAVVQAIGQLELAVRLFLLDLWLVLLVRFREQRRFRLLPRVQRRGTLDLRLVRFLVLHEFTLSQFFVLETRLVSLLAEQLAFLFLLALLSCLLLRYLRLDGTILERDDRSHRRVVLLHVYLGTGRTGDGRRTRRVRSQGHAVLYTSLLLRRTHRAQVGRYLKSYGVLCFLQWRQRALLMDDLQR